MKYGNRISFIDYIANMDILFSPSFPCALGDSTGYSQWKSTNINCLHANWSFSFYLINTVCRPYLCLWACRLSNTIAEDIFFYDR